MSFQETRKISKIVSELTSYLLKRGFFHVRFLIEKRKDETMIEITLPSVKIADVREMIEKIDQQSSPEIETYGWEVVGEAAEKDQLTVLGMLIDSVDVEETSENLVLTCRRKHKD